MLGAKAISETVLQQRLDVEGRPRFVSFTRRHQSPCRLPEDHSGIGPGPRFHLRSLLVIQSDEDGRPPESMFTGEKTISSNHTKSACPPRTFEKLWSGGGVRARTVCPIHSANTHSQPSRSNFWRRDSDLAMALEIVLSVGILPGIYLQALCHSRSVPVAIVAIPAGHSI